MYKHIALSLLITTTVATHGMDHKSKNETTFTRPQQADVYFNAMLNNQKKDPSQKKPTKKNTIKLPTGNTTMPRLFIVTNVAKL